MDRSVKMADLWVIEAEALKKYIVKNGVNVEVGCGCRKVDPCVIGVDPIVKGKTANMGRPSVADLEGVISSLSELFEENSVDSVLMGHALHYEANTEEALRSVYSVLKPGGVVAVIDLVPERQDSVKTMTQFTINWLSLEGVRIAGECAGFESVEGCEAVGGWSFIWAGMKPYDCSGRIEYSNVE
jgi:SAM-dependent methyltransferase